MHFIKLEEQTSFFIKIIIFESKQTNQQSMLRTLFLVVTDVNYLDTGLYVCQISTHPPKELHTRVRVKGKKDST